MKDFLIYLIKVIAKWMGEVLAFPFMLIAWMLLAPVMAAWDGFERDKLRKENEKRWAREREKND